MRLLGANNIQELGPRFVSRRLSTLTPYKKLLTTLLTLYQINTRMLERDIYDGEPNLDKTGLWEKSGLLSKSRL